MKLGQALSEIYNRQKLVSCIPVFLVDGPPIHSHLSVKARAYRRRGHATPHMPVETAKCWRLLKIEPNAWAGGKGSCAVCVDLQAVGALEFFDSLAREREGSIFSNHQHFAVSTGICGVACPLLLYALGQRDTLY